MTDSKRWSAELVGRNEHSELRRMAASFGAIRLTHYTLPKRAGRNLERMASGRAPIGPDGKPVNLHHMIQSNDSAIAEMTQTFHQKNSSVIHINPNTIPSGVDRAAFDAWRSRYWNYRSTTFGQ